MALVGDRERDRAAALLRTHYVRGRLSLEELAERLELALTARRDGDVRVALTELPPTWYDQAVSAPAWLAAVRRRAARAAFVIAVWLLWWIASLILFVGFVVSVLVGGLSVTSVLTFAALWLVCTFVARSVSRRRLSAQR